MCVCWGGWHVVRKQNSLFRTCSHHNQLMYMLWVSIKLSLSLHCARCLLSAQCVGLIGQLLLEVESINRQMDEFAL